MNIYTPFVVPIGVFDLSRFLPDIRLAFDAAKKTGDLTVGSKKAGFWTTLKTYQDDSKEDLKFLAEPSAFENALLDASVEFASAIGYSASKENLKVRNLWLNQMESGTEHGPHRHPAKQFSGCFYVDVPENSGDIMFHSFRERFDYLPPDVQQYTVFNADTYSYAPKEGELFLWESWLKHSVPSANFVGVRRSMAIDIVAYKG